MGYRSEVAVAVEIEDYKKYIEGNSDFTDLLNEAEIITNNKVVVINWQWIKWYSEYEDIAKFNSVLYNIAKNDHSYAFTRIGEANGDIEYVDAGEKDLGQYIYPVTYIEKPIGWRNID